MSITIQHNVPIPERYTSHSDLRVKLKAMKVGDSFIYPTQTVLYWAAEKEGVHITTRKMDGEGFRVWRIATPSERREIEEATFEARADGCHDEKPRQDYIGPNL